MKVTVGYLSILRDATGKKDEVLELPEGSTVRSLMDALMEKYGDRLKAFLEPDSEVSQGIIVTLNGELLSAGDMERRIPDRAVLLVGLPPFGG